MRSTTVHHNRIAPVVSLFVHERDRDLPGMSIPRLEAQLVVRFGPHARHGLDAHVMGVRQRVHRKVIRAGQRSVTARLRLGMQEAVFGVTASETAGRIIALEELWGDAAAGRLFERLAGARDTIDAAAILEREIAERVAVAGAHLSRSRVALEAAERLANRNVQTVARDLGVSERHLRRVFREAIGVSPIAFVRLVRFRRALHAARNEARASWARIAAETGYYDQAHLIAEFRAIAGMTPRELVEELRGKMIV